MAFFKNLFGKDKNVCYLTDDDVQRIFEEYLGDISNFRVSNPLLFRQCYDLKDGTKIYSAMLNVCIGDNRIPNNYYVLMHEVDACIVKQDFIKGAPILRIPPYFGLDLEYISFYDFRKYELQTSFVDYKGFYKYNKGDTK